MERKLAGRVAVVTGASSGIGAATARELARRGATVVLAARDEGRLEELRREIEAAGGRALPVRTDVAMRDSVRRMVEQAVGKFGRIDILVNNAGLGLSGRIAEVRPEDLRYVFEVNVIGALNCIQEALPHMRPGGRIINVSSVIGKRSIPMVGAYCATKAAMNALSDALRVEVAGAGITVTSVYPGTTRTAFRENSRRTGGEKRGWRPKGVPPERVAEKIARAAERGPRDVYVRPLDRLFVGAVTLLPGLADRVLRSWAKG
ncbi:short-chain dehydrogenase [Rubrobacter xylanophilus]|uniref:Short-chain dehydrogenase n=1 Tax=Rubrobacter xylanophilus TaxID=49319 RepID=A0A510HKF6_9ACTN|nr:SDR family NAD(P)-dependent oxidoreductase [Rubrobacter xylanophilus]BBL80506.1 short-chain dehydrogenase [Rubrobacter xylanophilus]